MRQTIKAFSFFFFRNQVLEMFDHAYSNYMVSEIPVCLIFLELLLLTWERKQITVHDILENQQGGRAENKAKINKSTCIALKGKQPNVAFRKSGVREVVAFIWLFKF